MGERKKRYRAIKMRKWKMNEGKLKYKSDFSSFT